MKKQNKYLPWITRGRKEYESCAQRWGGGDLFREELALWGINMLVLE